MRAVIRRAVVVAAAVVAAAVPAAAASAAPAPAVSWSQGGTPVTSYGYGTVNAGSSADRTFTLTNSGGAATAALTITASGPGFSIPSGGDRCTGTSLGPGKSCTVTVRYAPAGAGHQNDTGALTAASPKIKASLALHGASNTVTVTSPGNQTSTVGTAVSLPISASDSGSGLTLTYSATGLPAGLSIDSGTGLITGTPATAATSAVTVTTQDTDGGSGSASFTWTVNPAPVPVTVSVSVTGGTMNSITIEDLTTTSSGTSCNDAASCSLPVSSGDSIEVIMGGDSQFDFTCPGTGSQPASSLGGQYYGNCGPVTVTSDYRVTASFGP